MFEALGDKLAATFRKLGGRGVLTEDMVADAMREIRVALLEADVALPVVKSFIENVKAKAVGVDALKAVRPDQQIVKIVHDELVALLGAAAAPLNMAAAPSIILMAGLQGSGKTTTAGKLARHLLKDKQKVLLASLDTRRPAAQEQLALLAAQTGAGSLPIIANEQPLAITARALQTARLEGYDVLILDTAGRLSIDDELMAEITAVKAAANPAEVLLVLDAMTGQDAVVTAEKFHAALGVTGLVLTRIDGDARGGAALSLRATTGQPIKFLGTGEKLDALEPFHPDRLAQRILGMGDVVSLVERAAANVDAEAAAKLEARMNEGKFDLDDMAAQFAQMQNMGGLGAILNFLPGAGQLKNMLAGANVDEKALKHQAAILSSMTKAERRTPDILHASRKRRIALGAGVDVAAVNRLLKQYMGMRDMMKQMKKMGKGNFLRQAAGMMGGKGLPAGTQLPPELTSKFNNRH